MVMLLKNKFGLILFILSSVLFIPFLGGVNLFDWDEVNFAEISREMIVSGNYLNMTVNFEPFYEKPPLFFWLQVLSMKIFGINEFAARFPNAITGIITILFLYFAGRKIKNPKFGFIWAFSMMVAVLPNMYYKSGIIDPLFNLWMFLSVYFGWMYLHFPHKKVFHAVSAGLFAGLAMLTKGPVGLLLPALSLLIYFLIHIRKFKINIFEIILSVTTAIAFPLFLYLLVSGFSLSFIVAFVERNIALFSQPDAGHGGFLLYHFPAVFAGMLPASVFAIENLFRKNVSDNNNGFRALMLILLIVVMLVFTIVKTKIIHYSSLAYFPVSYLAALCVYNILYHHFKLSALSKILLLSFSGLFAIAGIAFPLIMNNREILYGLFSDLYSKEAFLAPVDWPLYLGAGFILFGSLFFIFVIKWFKNLVISKYLIIATFSFVLMIHYTLHIFLGRVEAHSQASLVEFCEEYKGENVVFMTMGFKSYIPYFYGNSMPHSDLKGKNKYEILTSTHSKTIYVITKLDKSQEIMNLYTLTELYRKNGYVFLTRTKN